MKYLFLFLALPAFAAAPKNNPILTELSLLDKVGATILVKEESIGLGYAEVTPAQQEEISAIMHAKGKCAGFEAVSFSPVEAKKELRALALRAQREARLASIKTSVTPEPALAAALNELKAENIQATVAWLSAFPTRYNRATEPNRPIEAMADRIRATLATATIPWSVDLISHQSTPQKSIRVRFPGKARPSEIIVAGGHIDSITPGSPVAPGADDNASGSASILEAMRIFATKSQPERTVEFFWYAGEESGLLGSSEIARQYKQEQKDVVAVLQLDMTMFPGSGQFTIMNTTDFTSGWLTSYLKAMNDTYLKLKIVDDECGYACSDHASWHRQGYPSVFPFEAPFDSYNKNIHSRRDVIDGQSDFQHALMFSKFTLIYVLDLGNSTARQPI